MRCTSTNFIAWLCYKLNEEAFANVKFSVRVFLAIAK